MLVVTTESGTAYQFADDMKSVRRVAEASSDTKGSAEMRRDGDWVTLVSYDTIVVGSPMLLVLDGVAEWGITYRRTTNVVSMEMSDGPALR